MSKIEGDLVVAGALTPKSMNVPAGSVTNAAIKAAAGISASKLEHQQQPRYSQESDTTAAAEDHVLHTVYGATGTVVAFAAGCVVACTGNAVVTVDLHKNGSSMLISAIEIDNGDAAYDVVAGTVDPAKEDVVVDDVLEVVVTVNAGTGALGKGVFAYAAIEEDTA